MPGKGLSDPCGAQGGARGGLGGLDGWYCRLAWAGWPCGRVG